MAIDVKVMDTLIVDLVFGLLILVDFIQNWFLKLDPCQTTPSKYMYIGNICVCGDDFFLAPLRN